MIKVSPFIYVNLTSSSCCLFFLSFLVFTYFTKKNMNNADNRLYKHMLICNFISTIFYVLFYSTDIIAAFSKDPSVLYPVVYVFSKFAALLFGYWGVFFVVYLYYITHEKDKDFIARFQAREKKMFKIIYICLFILGILHCLEKNDVNLATGVEYNLLIYLSIVLYGSLGYGIFLIIKNFKKIDKKKSSPVFFILPIALVAIASSLIGVPVVLLIVMMTAINHLMFHTIENPDVKLINELELAKSQAERASQAKSDFLSSMSHELRTPINAITGLSSVIKETSTDMDSRNDASDIFNSSTKLLELVDGILAINKLEASDIEIIEKQYNPIELFDNCIKSAKVRLNDKPIEIKTNYSEDIPCMLYGDSDKIKTILNNLLSNAVKYTDTGTIKLAVDALEVKGKWNLTFTISDTGHGIKEDQIPNLFTKFYRSEENKDSDIEGTGLGLAITKSLIELMDGKISVNSTYGVGTTFVVNLSQKSKADETVQETKPEVVQVPNPVVTPVVTPVVNEEVQVPNQVVAPVVTEQVVQVANPVAVPEVKEENKEEIDIL